MQGKIKLTKQAHEKMLAHLVDIEERKVLIADEYYREMDEERISFISLLDKYITLLDKTLRKTEISEEAYNEFPFVSIYSEVRVSEPDTGEGYSYKIIPPEADDLQKADEITYLSPVGKALMLRKSGDTVVIKAPQGEYSIKIESIKLF